ncbi:multicopper oxidase family protein [Fimbriimonas ginsengisoli Gsoil 348]|uniref:Multicopper oxidase family protein n=1 Tax=Fimbriimonas ginsengisoli Gsoil 348 TaxID=661478 RepID=A0A068NT55_FIMGI|nr:twin-arginine translocation signal domain-containing protein [Fimbriimonas ginsengisoli]AIE86586.1 multicopper oxidase family protein [Fimbriimonas ginsengisoli Gsoil 348]
MNDLNRRQFISLATATALGGATEAFRPGKAFANPPRVAIDGPADYTIRIGTGLIEAAPDKIVSTKTYNGGFPPTHSVERGAASGGRRP